MLENLALKSTTHPLPTLHFAVQYEATRVALNKGLTSDSLICAHLHGYCDDLYEAKDYPDVWRTLTRFSEAATALERTNESVWRSFKDERGWSDNIYMSGKVHFGEFRQVHGSAIKDGRSSQARILSEPPLIITLNPLTRTTGNRFFNRFGSDRFLTLRLPPLTSNQGLPNNPLHPKQAQERIVDWLSDEDIVLMNRTWKCFYIKNGVSKRKPSKDKPAITEYFSQAMFFATKGVGIGDSLNDREMEALGFKNSYKKLRQEMSVGDFLKWHIPLEGNLEMTVPKFWSRISLGQYYHISRIGLG